ncbi:MAG: hypothetical protein GY790_08015 [Bacteroidetes bacterium]|nr:hypothetical protein [Bacteroidota bacterium]
MGEFDRNRRQFLGALALGSAHMMFDCADTYSTHGVSVHSLNAMKAAPADPWEDVLHARIIGMKVVGNGKFKEEIA